MNWDFFLIFSFFPFYIYKEKKEKNDKYRNLVISIVLTNNFHIEYSTKKQSTKIRQPQRQIDNSKILIFLIFLRTRVERKKTRNHAFYLT